MSILRADARHIPLADGVVQCVVSSPPYYGLRDYQTGRWAGGADDCDHRIAPSNTAHAGDVGPRNEAGNAFRNSSRYVNQPQFKSECPCGARRIDSQIGLERSIGEYVETMVAVFRDVRRVLRDDGVVWLNLGDSYAHNGPCGGGSPDGPRKPRETDRRKQEMMNYRVPDGLKPKDLCGIPWRIAFALQADGWYLRSDIIWAKPNPMPESVTDRPTRSHEYLFLLSKNERYFYDGDAIREPHLEPWRSGKSETAAPKALAADKSTNLASYSMKWGIREYNPAGRNRRSVWTINSEPYPESHFATFPKALVQPCILAGTPERGSCSKCGTPWVRVTDVSYDATNRTPAPNKGRLGAMGERAANLTRDGFVPNRDKHVTTLGWQPQCRCDAPPRPSLVFDPFGGSGTVGEVCEALGRRWVTTDLSHEYCLMALRRTAQRGLFV